MTTLPLKLHKIFARVLCGKWSHFMMMRKSNFLYAQLNDLHIIKFQRGIEINFLLLIAVNYFLLSLFSNVESVLEPICLDDVDFFKSHDKNIFSYFVSISEFTFKKLVIIKPRIWQIGLEKSRILNFRALSGCNKSRKCS